MESLTDSAFLAWVDLTAQPAMSITKVWLWVTLAVSITNLWLLLSDTRDVNYMFLQALVTRALTQESQLY